MAVKLIPLTTWGAQVYGDAAPKIGTLRRWARDGRIYPPAQKHGRVYFVAPNAQYMDLDFGSRLIGKIANGTAPA